jgi:hypothetical protein
MHYLSSVYFINQPLHVSGIFAAHHQEVYCIFTAIGMCCAFQLTVCWPGWDGTIFITQMYRDAWSTKHKINTFTCSVNTILVLSD